MSLLRAFDYAVIALSGNIELPIYLCIENAIIEKLIFSHEKDVPDSNVLYTCLSVIDKGADGLGNTELDYITNNPDDEEHYLAFTPYTIHEILLNVPVVKNHVYSFKKVDTGGNVDLGFSACVVNERRY